MQLKIKVVLFVLGVSRLRFTAVGQAVRSRFYVFALRDKTIKSSTAILHATYGMQQYEFL
jgi:hypothetical protein